MNKLLQTGKLGQQIWLDNLSRRLIRTQTFKKLISAGVSGITTNPAIFAKAITNDPLYAEEIEHLKKEPLTAKERYEHLATADVVAACDAFRRLYQDSGRQQGYVSIELDPNLATDAAASIKEAKRLWQTINRPNLMIKVPINAVGITIFTHLISLGFNVNATLLFSRLTIKKIYTAYVDGIKTRIKNGSGVTSIRAVASFFMSRIDTALDPDLPPALQGQTALNLARGAYQDYLDFCNGAAGALLHHHQVEPPWLLWASTTTKNPDYADTFYVDNLIGAKTVNTLAQNTLEYFQDHGSPRVTLPADTAAAERSLRALTALGFNPETLALRLQEQGLEQFKTAFQQILTLLS